ncbi:MAG: glutathione S-transferase family protein [Nevskia sp.]|nr:glutathione S-transferase family protein [Nevskia sp.]
MNDIILHHYALSPFSEKIRTMLGYKQLAWKSVTQPAVMPKPDLLPLTGGYRKAPVMQIGRDIYCDTALMSRVIERLQPQRPLLSAPLRASCAAFASLEQTLFLASIPVVFQPAGMKVIIKRLGAEVFERFRQDRAALFTGGIAPWPNAEFSKIHFLPLINALDLQLAAGPFLLGEAPTLADFICYHPVWFVLSNPGVAGQLAAFKNLLAWAERVRGFGHGTPTELDAADAVAIARSTAQGQPFDGPLLEPEKFKLGQTVSVSATDYGCEPVIGTLLHASVFELAIKRQDERAGEIIVHFPRQGFKVAAV